MENMENWKIIGIGIGVVVYSVMFWTFYQNYKRNSLDDPHDEKW